MIFLRFLSRCRFRHLPGAAAVLALLLFTPYTLRAAVLTEDTVWSGSVELSEDLLVPKGITLTIAAGTVITVLPTESTKTDPEFLSPLNEIMVRGHLEAEGGTGNPVIFRVKKGMESGSEWAGIIIDDGNAWLHETEISDAEAALTVLQGWAKVKRSKITGNRYGLLVQGADSGLKVEKSRIADNEYGILSLNNAILIREESVIEKNTYHDVEIRNTLSMPDETREQSLVETPQNITRTYGSESLVGDTIWQGRIVINGVVRLPVTGRLIILPGTVVEFTRWDTNGDSIGESGLLLQGVLVAKGTAGAPIIFRSAEKDRQRGDWDAINILGSDGTQNLIEYCRIEDAYRGLHFHFANVAINHVSLHNNYRGIQFQESLVSITNSLLRDNRSGIQARDSEVVLTDTQFYDHHTGANFFRLNLLATGNRFYSNQGSGIRIREGRAVMTGNTIDTNRAGLRISDALYGIFSNNIINGNSETGLAIRSSDNIEVSGNILQFNGSNGLSIQDSGGLIENNIISDNRERGIGIDTFNGTISGNTVVNNGLFAMDIDGPKPVNAPGNWWGASDIAAVISDAADDPATGRAIYEPALSGPPVFPWKIQKIRTHVAWHGAIRVDGKVDVLRDADLTIAPGTAITLTAADSGLLVTGALHALGTADRKITFSLAPDQGSPPAPEDDEPRWDEVSFERARDSVLRYVDFHYASWAVHSHFTRLRVENCRFFDNYGGIRFRSGPISVTSTLFSRNIYAMRSLFGKGDISGNTFQDNEINIFIRSGGSGVIIRGNNFLTTSRYAVRLGDFNREEVDARENWWDGKNPQEMIFDENQEPGVGRVLFTPALSAPAPSLSGERQ